MKIGSTSVNQLRRLASTWKQGEHLIIIGATGSGKTLLARYIDQIRLDRNGHVAVFVCKLGQDETITKEYAGWTRWKTWKKHPNRDERRVLLWPDTSKAKDIDEARAIQKAVFKDAFDSLSKRGHWTIHIDEGLYMCDREFMNLGSSLAMLHYMGRSSRVTIVTLAQRPSHIPLVVYSSASNAFIGRTREDVDAKRLSELAGKNTAKELRSKLDTLGKHDFLWIPVDSERDPEKVNLSQ